MIKSLVLIKRLVFFFFFFSRIIFPNKAADFKFKSKLALILQQDQIQNITY